MSLKLLVLATIVLSAFAVNWAVLTAGSSGFSNYRHQSDIFHSYQVLLKRGFQPQNIIVLAYDDIASSTSNPYRGKVYNKPTFKDPGVDVYEGVKIDYSGKHVIPKLFENVLIGNSSYVKGIGTERVLNSTADDNVFIYFSDHGAPGLIAFPSSRLLADQLLKTLASMKGRYNKLVFYLETCESGSMFVKLPTDTKIYALSAAGTSQSSWATYCSPNDVIAGKHIKSCLGDLFSVSFIEDLQASTDTADTLQEQFTRVKKLTTQSKVMQWGDLSFANDSLVEFFGTLPASEKKPRSNWVANLIREKQNYHKVSTYHTKIDFLMNQYEADKTDSNFELVKKQLIFMSQMDNVFDKIKTELNLTGKYDVQNINFDCYRDSMNFFEQNCAQLQNYPLQYMKYFVENCQINSSDVIEPIILRECKRQE